MWVILFSRWKTPFGELDCQKLGLVPFFAKLEQELSSAIRFGESLWQVLSASKSKPNVGSMTTVINSLAALAPLGAQLIAEVKASTMTKTELARMLDVPKSEASMLRAVAKVFDTEELEHAERQRLSIAKLRIIARTEKQLANPDIDRRDFRLALIDVASGYSVDELNEYVRAQVCALNEGYNRHRKWYMRYSALSDTDGMRHVMLKLPSEVATRLSNSLEPQAMELAATGIAVDKAEGHAKALVDRVLHGCDLTKLEAVEAGENPNNPRDLRQRPCFLIPIEEIAENCDGTVTNTDGETVNISELVDARLADFGFAVTVYRDTRGIARPKDLMEVKRLADADDRFLTIVNHLICQHPDCRVPAVRCEAHHIIAFSRGGQTIPENLCPLCREDNLANDDNPEKIKHGRIITDPKTGMVWFRSPEGTLRRNKAEANNRNAMSYAHRILKPQLPAA